MLQVLPSNGTGLSEAVCKDVGEKAGYSNAPHLKNVCDVLSQNLLESILFYS